QTVDAMLREAIRCHQICSRAEEDEHISSLLVRVGLSAGDRVKYAREFSGGQRQRIGIARALSVQPGLICADEPVSSLDVSIQAHVLELLRGLQRDMGLSMLLITHDLAVVRAVSDRVMVMYMGQVVEEGATDDLFRNPHHPYTHALISAAPRLVRLGPQMRPALEGDPPSPIDPPDTCRFRSRCHDVMPVCGSTPPQRRPVDVAKQHYSLCHLEV
ncbi:MAG: ABC transporter ATP-binding protein, partial [Actinobacteria bacterium]|nr:ABC transporter ATP-binding protein [Actinomycetota bacterium]